MESDLCRVEAPSRPYRRAVASRGVASWRLAAGVAILVALLGFCGVLFRPYLQNWRLQTYLEQLVVDPARVTQAELLVRTDVVNQAAQLGLPVSGDQVRITRSKENLYVEIRYFVHVDLLLYTVDLHFRPAAGVR